MLQTISSTSHSYVLLTNSGLWNVCLQDFKDVKHLYDKIFNGCRHVLDEEYHIIDWLLRPCE